VLFLLNWAAGPEPLGAVIGRERVLLSFPTAAGTMDGDVVRYRPPTLLTRRFPMPVGEPDGRATPRLERIVRAFRAAGINAKAHPQMDSWLKTHAAFVVPLGQAVLAAGGPGALADDPDAVRDMIRLMRQRLADLPTRPVPRGFVALQILPEGLLAVMLRRFLRGPTAAHSGLDSATPAAEAAELERLAEQMRQITRGKSDLAGDGGDDRGHDPADGRGIRLGRVDVGEEQVGGAHQGRGERADVGVGREAAELPLGGEVAADHGGGLRQQREPGAGGGPQPGPELVTGDHQADERQVLRCEQPGERGGQVAGDGAGAGGGAQIGGLDGDPGDPGEREVDQEGVEIGEVAVQHALGDPRLGGDGPAGQAAGPVAEQDAFGRLEQLPARVANRHPCRHRDRPFRVLRRTRTPAPSGHVPI
jgi:hypothetical protein